MSSLSSPGKSPLCPAVILTGTLLFAGIGAPAAGYDEDEPDPPPRIVLPDESAYSPSKEDGQGTASVTPTLVAVHEPVTLTFTYTAGDLGIAIGGGVACLVSQFWYWTPPQDLDPRSAGYVTVRCSDPAVGLETVVDRTTGAIVARIRDRPLQPGASLVFTYGDTSGGAHPGAQGLSDRYAERSESFWFKVDGDGDGFFAPVEEQPRLDVEARQPHRFTVLGPASARVGEPFQLHLSVLDRDRNLVERFRGEAKLTVTLGRAELRPEVALSGEDRGTKRVEVVPREPGVLLVEARDPEGELETGRSNPILVSEAPDGPYRLYWADLQGHSNFSDGSASPQEWWRYAREVARLDVAALTDHDHWGYTLLDEDAESWKHLKKLSASFYEPGEFVSFPGYEWTNWQYGHKHVLCLRENETDLWSAFHAETDHPEELWAALGSRDCITISHHPGGGPIPTFWKYHHRRFEPVVELISVHGVSEAVGHPRCIHRPVESGMVQSALARGHRLGFVGSGDTHDGHPGLGGADGSHMGLAGIYATELTREGILEALRARRVYATTGCRAILRFHLGSVTMGGVANLETTEQRRTLTISVFGDAPIAQMTIVKNNRSVYGEKGSGRLESWEWTDTEPAQDGDYYYVRIAQVDGHWIYSSPIWVELTTP